MQKSGIIASRDS